MHFEICFNLEQFKILSSGNVLRGHFMISVSQTLFALLLLLSFHVKPSPFVPYWITEWMNGVLRPVNNSGHIGHTYILNTNAKWK